VPLGVLASLASTTSTESWQYSSWSEMRV
jgi:hypothetical protein